MATRKAKTWPTKRLPRAPVSAAKDGDPLDWTEEQWQKFHAWALSLKDYPPLKEVKEQL